RNATAENVTQQVYLVDRPESKRGAVVRLIKRLKLQQVIVFTNTKIGASRLARELQKEGISADAIHGDKSQGERLITLERFKRGEVLVLVATDVAARGLDIAELPAVINYDVPYAAEDYVHRIGRTGRAGASGQAISVMSPVDERLMQDIEKLIGKKLVREKLPGLDMPPGADPLFFLPYEDDSSPAASSAKAAAPAQSPLLTGSAKRLVGAAVLLGGKPRLTGQ
ncbi:MAG: ATP-dependent helicase, partial [Betaproteobacteria bacterium]|nr:ATP-dependent helicase [Betaproteobacteria bacterium]